jgi:hypothetical protein
MTPQHAAVILAQLAAIKAVRQSIKRAGGNLSTIPYSRLTRLGREWLEQHPEMLAEALRSPIIAALASPPLPRRRRKAATTATSKG